MVRTHEQLSTFIQSAVTRGGYTLMEHEMARLRETLVLGIVIVLGTASAATNGQSSVGRPGGGMAHGSFLHLLSMEQVQKELKLSVEQTTRVRAILREFPDRTREEINERAARLQEIEDVQKRRLKMFELIDWSDEKARREIDEVLSGEQMIRLYQIRLQVRGALYGLNNKWIAGRLELTDEQQKKAAELEKATRLRIMDDNSWLRNLTPDQRRANRAKHAENRGKIRREANEKALGLLTAEQKEALERIKGQGIELQM
jgi:hypothetical protein